MREVPVRVNINVVLVQEEKGPIESMEKTSRKKAAQKKGTKKKSLPRLDIHPDGQQGD